ncbi:hypothetical protein D3C87_1619370 [compost metagenome]
MSPTTERNSTIPSSRNARLALGGINQYSLPMQPIRPRISAMINGPPARPSFSATGKPGTYSGIDPSNTPRPMPINTGSICTCCNFCCALPTISATASMEDGRPTRLRISPNCRLASGLATSSMPARLRRDITTS